MVVTLTKENKTIVEHKICLMDDDELTNSEFPVDEVSEYVKLICSIKYSSQ